MSEPSKQSLCTVCGEPMPEGEEMFKFHGYSCDCPKPPLPRPDRIRELEQQHKEQEAAILKIAKRMEKTIYPTILGSFAAELRAIFAPKE